MDLLQDLDHTKIQIQNLSYDVTKLVALNGPGFFNISTILILHNSYEKYTLESATGCNKHLQGCMTYP